MNGYTPSQASAVTGLPLAAVHKAIDSRIIRPRTARLLSKEQLTYLRLEVGGLRMLPVSTRREVAESIRQTPKADFVLLGEGSVLTVEVKNARRQVESQLTQLARIEDFVASHPDIMGGTPVFKGTRIPVDLVADMLAQGATVEEIVDGYPALTKEKIRLAPFYIQAFPRRGRPRRKPLLQSKTLRKKSFSLMSAHANERSFAHALKNEQNHRQMRHFGSFLGRFQCANSRQFKLNA